MNTNLQMFIDQYGEWGETMKADGFDEAIIGIDGNQRLVYDIHIIIKILTDEGMTTEEALEHFYYNIAGAYVGDHTPIFIFTYQEFKNEFSIN